jgi:hypothetical protein
VNALGFLNREVFAPAGKDGWFLAVPAGEFPHAESGQVQVIDREAIERMDFRFKQDRKDLVVDRDHFHYDSTRSSEASGWIVNTRPTPKGLEVQIRWTDLGEVDLSNGRYRYCSPVFLAGDVEKLGGNRIRPFRLDSLGLTNQPNIPMAPLTNRAEAGRTQARDAKTVTVPIARELFGFVLSEETGAADLRNRAAKMPDDPYEASVLFEALVNRRMIYHKETYGQAYAVIGRTHAEMARKGSEPCSYKRQEAYWNRLNSEADALLKNRRGDTFEMPMAEYEKIAPAVFESHTYQLDSKVRGAPRLPIHCTPQMINQMFHRSITEIKDRKPGTTEQEAWNILKKAWPELWASYIMMCHNDNALAGSMAYGTTALGYR